MQLKASSSLVIGRDAVGASVVLRPVGDLDMLTAPALRTALHRPLNRGRQVVLDLAGVTFLDASALQVLLDAHERARACDGVLRITGVAGRQLRRPFEITGLDTVLSISAGPADALELLTPQGSAAPCFTTGSGRPR